MFMVLREKSYIVLAHFYLFKKKNNSVYVHKNKSKRNKHKNINGGYEWLDNKVFCLHFLSLFQWTCIIWIIEQL